MMLFCADSHDSFLQNVGIEDADGVNCGDARGEATMVARRSSGLG